MADKHTPTPWREGRWSHSDDGVTIRSSTGLKVAVALYLGGTEQAKINAALIVRAVNCHEELVEALREIAEGAGAFNRNPLLHAENVIEEAKATARAVLAKVEASDG